MIISHISASDIGGGAAIAANRLHRGLRRIGVDSRMVVGSKQSDDEFVLTAQPSRSLSGRVRRRLRSRSIQGDFERYRATRPAHLEYFSDDRAPNPECLLDALPTADVYNLHWIAGFLDYRAFFSKVGNRVPIVWTLHDMNQFTGGCHYTAGCQKFLEECGRCPALGSDHANDLAYRIYRRKRAVFESLDPSRIRIVADSRWLETVASKSALLERFTVTCIPYGLDVENFQPRNQAIARNVFGIPPDAKVVMFAAQSLGNHRKGMDLLIEAIRSLRVETQVILLAVGSGRVPDDIGRTCISTGKLNSERFLSFAYSAADVFVSPAREEAFGQVNLESIACGTPVVAFKVGGIPDVVRPGKTGLLAAPEDVRSLREAMETILADRPLRDTMSQECRQVALREYTLELQAGRYKHLYEELIQSILRQPYTSAPLEAVTV